MSTDDGTRRAGAQPAPRPAGWAAERPSMKLAAVTVVSALVGLVTTAAAVSALFTAEPLYALPFGVFGLFLIHLAGFSAYAWRAPRRPTGNAQLVPSAGGGPNGVRFRYSARAYYWFAGMLVTLILSTLAVAAAFAVLAGAVGVVVGVVLGAAALFLTWFLVAALRRAPGEVTVSPAGIFHQGLTSYHFVPWYAVDSVEAQRLGGPVIVVKAFAAEDTVVGSFTGRFGAGDLAYLPFLVIRAPWLGTDPATVHHALAFYHAHPDLRDETGTPAGLDRVNRGRAVVGH